MRKAFGGVDGAFRGLSRDVYTPRVPFLLDRIVTLAGVSAAAAAVLWWGRLPGPWRRGLALLTSALGVLFLLWALRAEGHREASTTAVVILGPAYVTEQASASASLRYYVMTGVCLLLGTAGLAVSDRAAGRLGRRWMAAAPASWTRPMGVTWLAPIVGAFFAVSARKEGRGLGAVAGALLVYGLVVRGLVALLSVLATAGHLGSHYDVSALVYVKNPLSARWYEFASGSFAQLFYLTLLPQLVFWPIYTVVVGMIGAGVALLLPTGGLQPRVPIVGAGVRMAPAQPER